MRKLLFLCILLPLVIAIDETDQWVKSDHVKLSDHINLADRTSVFHIALKQNANGILKLERYILEHLSNIESPLYGQYMTIEEINGLTKPSRETIDQVSTWLDANGITNCKLYGDSMRCEDTVININRLFDVRMEPYYNKMNAQSRLRANRPYTFPDHLDRHIDFVDGISNPLPLFYAPKLHKYDEAATSNADGGGFSREVMNRLYNLSKLDVDSSVSVGAIEYMGSQSPIGFSNKDLLTSEKTNGVASNPITPDHLIGIKNDFPDGESELDVQMMYWGAPAATLWYEGYSGWMYGWSVDFFNRENIPEVASISYGWDETQQCDIIPCENTTSKGYVSRCNTEFMKLAARGVTLLVSSGDAGSPGRSNELCQSEEGPYGWNNINANFPGGSPWVLSVGATYLVASTETFNYSTPICNDYAEYNINCSYGTKEQGVYYNETYWTSGGGFTHWDQTPDWQVNNVKTYLNSGVVLPKPRYFNPQGRAYPDVSAVGHNCIVNLRDGTGLGQWAYLDGTSCSAPVFAGVITRLNYFRKQQGKPVLGFVNPLLYKMASESPRTFNDVTKGTTQCTEHFCYYNDQYWCTEDFGFQATKGWDPVGGLGTPNVGQMLEYLSNTL